MNLILIIIYRILMVVRQLILPFYSAIAAIIITGNRQPSYTAYNLLLIFGLIALEALIFALVMLRNRKISIKTTLNGLNGVALYRMLGCFVVFAVANDLILNEIVEYQLEHNLYAAIFITVFAMALPMDVIDDSTNGVVAQIRVYLKHNDKYLKDLAIEKFEKESCELFEAEYNRYITQALISRRDTPIEQIQSEAKTHAANFIMDPINRHAIEDQALDELMNEIKIQFHFTLDQDHLDKEFRIHLTQQNINFAYIMEHLGAK